MFCTRFTWLVLLLGKAVAARSQVFCGRSDGVHPAVRICLRGGVAGVPILPPELVTARDGIRGEVFGLDGVVGVGENTVQGL